MANTLLERLQDKYGEQYDIKEVEKFYEYNITMIPAEDDNHIYKLRMKSKDNSFIYTTWHRTEDTLLNHLLRYTYEPTNNE